MSNFRKLEGDTVVLQQGGVYKPSDLYEWNGDLFAKASGGYVRLRTNGTTSKDGVMLNYLETDRPLYQDKFGRLTCDPTDHKPVSLSGDGQLQIEKK